MQTAMLDAQSLIAIAFHVQLSIINNNLACEISRFDECTAGALVCEMLSSMILKLRKMGL